MQYITTSSALIVQARLLQLLSQGIDPELIQQEIALYLTENGVETPYFLYDRNNVASAAWIIEHNLNKYPHVTLIDDDGNMFEADVFYNSLNQVTVVFAEPTSGKAVLS